MRTARLFLFIIWRVRVVSYYHCCRYIIMLMALSLAENITYCLCLLTSDRLTSNLNLRTMSSRMEPGRQGRQFRGRRVNKRDESKRVQGLDGKVVVSTRRRDGKLVNIKTPRRQRRGGRWGTR